MKKGKEVRVKGTYSCGLIADSVFFNRGGKKCVSYAVKFPDMPEPVWYPKEQLTSPVEHVSISISAENGSLQLEMDIDWRNGSSNVEVIGCPEKLEQHKGTHVLFASRLMDTLSK